MMKLTRPAYSLRLAEARRATRPRRRRRDAPLMRRAASDHEAERESSCVSTSADYPEGAASERESELTMRRRGATKVISSTSESSESKVALPFPLSLTDSSSSLSSSSEVSRSIVSGTSGRGFALTGPRAWTWSRRAKTDVSLDYSGQASDEQGATDRELILVLIKQADPDGL